MYILTSANVLRVIPIEIPSFFLTLMAAGIHPFVSAGKYVVIEINAVMKISLLRNSILMADIFKVLDTPQNNNYYTAVGISFFLAENIPLEL
jgi:hypothetical protein